jgi:hypothetical protein
MTFDEIKQINIRAYLEQMNIYPVKDYGYYGMYYCPFRDDNNASFKVDYNKNIWYDFGTNEGGSIIDLVMRLGNCSFSGAVSRLVGCADKRNSVLSPQQSNDNDYSSCQTQVINIQPITHPKLIAWVQERKIDLALANLYCREIHYQNQSGQFFSVGFGNDKGGYELSSPPSFKGCFPPKDITTIRINNDSCLIFEGFWDFLSYLTIQKIEKSKHDIAVLNSVANVHKAMDFLKTHNAIYTYLDNDNAGQKATELIKSANSTVYNRSSQFVGYKDLNDYLRGKKQIIEKPKKLGLKL